MLTSIIDLVASPDGKFGFEQRHNIDAQMTSTYFRATFKTHVKTKEKLTEEFQIFIHELGHHLGHPEEKVILQTLMAGKASSFALNVADEYCKRVQIGRPEENVTVNQQLQETEVTCVKCASSKVIK